MIPPVSLATNITLANMWLHHEMNPFELSRHFGVESSHQVNPDMYQIIQIQTSGYPSATMSKRSVNFQIFCDFYIFNSISTAALS